MRVSDDSTTWRPQGPLALEVVGGGALSGVVEIHGSKKCVPKLIVASLLTDEPCSIEGVPRIDDVDLARQLAGCFGRTAVESEPRRIEISGQGEVPANPKAALSPLAVASRVPIVSAGVQLARFGEAWVPELGGDEIGARPIDEHVRLLKCLGAEVGFEQGFFRATTRGLRGARIELPYPMVGVTEHALLGASMIKGRTEVANVAVDPEILELATVLNEMGASVEVNVGQRRIAIDGVPELGGFAHAALPDRIEAGSWACAALATGGDILVRGATPTGMSPLLDAHRSVGGEAKLLSDGLRFTGSLCPRATIRIDTGPYPAFESDWQSPMLVALSQASRESIIHETVFEDRFAATQSLRRMGVDICLSSECDWQSGPCLFGREGKAHLAVVRGPASLVATRAHMPDLRNGFALTLAALSASGRSLLTGAETLRRGYENLPASLRSLGGTIDVVE
ncbi:MAG TPA: UDP-N-acetylglucosamine 1-carboxyvinyltransferase [Candidatus Dormibacteraeota bacterium]